MVWITDDNNRSPLFYPAASELVASFESTDQMALTRQEVSRIAHLARLQLQEPEQESMLTQLNAFFSIVDQMSAVDTRGVAPLYTPLSAITEVELRLRDDIVSECNDRERNQASAPAVEDGLFLVPKVLE